MRARRRGRDELGDNDAEHEAATDAVQDETDNRLASTPSVVRAVHRCPNAVLGDNNMSRYRVGHQATIARRVRSRWTRGVGSSGT